MSSAFSALREGLRRAAAPVVVAGTFAVTLGTARLAGWTPTPILGWSALLLNPSSPVEFTTTLLSITGAGIALIVVWAFLAGGVLDRFARNRPTRGRGFFGACGAHFPAILRLEIVALALLSLAAEIRLLGGPLAAAIAAVVAIDLVTDYARVRLVVEDRRSAIGAWLAGWRFARRNAGAAGLLYLLNAGLVVAAAALCIVLGRALLGTPGALQPVMVVCVLLRHYFKLAMHASETALFQSRLAHASYTAGPPVEWPESPAAEAIGNAAPTPTT